MWLCIVYTVYTYVIVYESILISILSIFWPGVLSLYLFSQDRRSWPREGRWIPTNTRWPCLNLSWAQYGTAMHSADFRELDHTIARYAMLFSPEVRLIPLEVGIRGRPEDCHKCHSDWSLCCQALCIGRSCNTWVEVDRSRLFSNVLVFRYVRFWCRPSTARQWMKPASSERRWRSLSRCKDHSWAHCMFQHGRNQKHFCMKQNLSEHFCSLYPEDSWGIQFVAHCFEHPGRWNRGIGAQGVWQRHSATHRIYLNSWWSIAHTSQNRSK